MLIFGDLKNFQDKFNLRNKNILIISSRSIIKKKKIIKLIQSLKEKNNLTIKSNIIPGAHLSDLKKLLKLKTPDKLIAIGGGSVMDIAKAFSCLKLNSEKYLITKKKIQKINLIVIPTISGSGAESSKGSILKADNNKKIAYRSKYLIPNYVYLDTQITRTAPKKLRCECLFDCLSHAIETYISKKSSNETKINSIDAIRAIMKINYKSIDNNYNQKQISLFSYKMGINLKKSTTCLPHRIQYALSEYTNITHAQSIIALYKGWLQVISTTNKFKELEKKIFIHRSLNYEIIKFKKKLKLNQNLNQLKLKKKIINTIINKTTGTLDLDPSYKSKKTIEEIINLSL